MARIALVTYWAPPQMAVASHRILRLSRTLIAAGHEVHWITLDRALIDKVDPTMEPLIPPEIVRHGLGGPCLITKPKADNIVEHVLRTLVYKLPAWFAVPDGYVEWTLRLRRNLVPIIREHEIDTVFYCCGPHGSILTIPQLRAQMPDLRILVDYRDILSGNFWNASDSPRTQAKLLKREQRALAGVDGMFLNNEHARARFLEIVKPREDMPAKVMRNTADYDLADTIAGKNGQQNGRFGDGIHLGYFGTLFERRPLSPVFDAMAKLPDDVLARVKVHCFCDDWSMGILQGHLEPYEARVKDTIVRHQPVPYGEALHAMRAMDVLLLVNGPTEDDRIFVPGKLYDYLMARRPVLFVGEPGDAYRIVADCCGEDWCSRHEELDKRVARLASLADGRLPDVEPNTDYAPRSSFEPLLTLLGSAE